MKPRLSSDTFHFRYQNTLSRNSARRVGTCGHVHVVACLRQVLQ